MCEMAEEQICCTWKWMMNWNCDIISSGSKQMAFLRRFGNFSNSDMTCHPAILPSHSTLPLRYRNVVRTGRISFSPRDLFRFVVRVFECGIIFRKNSENRIGGFCWSNWPLKSTQNFNGGSCTQEKSGALQWGSSFNLKYVCTQERSALWFGPWCWRLRLSRASHDDTPECIHNTQWDKSSEIPFTNIMYWNESLSTSLSTIANSASTKKQQRISFCNCHSPLVRWSDP